MTSGSATRPRLRAQRSRQIGTFAGLVVLCVVLWAATPHFLTISNLLNVLEQTSINAIVAVGMTFVIISGGIDLSVGSVLAVAGIALALALEGRAPAPAAIILALATGTACGLANGLLITFGRLPPFIATLGMWPSRSRRCRRRRERWGCERGQAFLQSRIAS